MVGLTDRLDGVVGAKAAGPLAEVFGIRTVGELLRHYPRTYVEGAKRRGVDAGERPPAGEHVTVVDTITSAIVRTMPRKRPGQRDSEYLVITVGHGRNKLSATFFHAKGIKWQLTPKTRVMLSGEVGYYRGAMQLTHPAFLVMDSPGKRNVGSESLRKIAEASEAVSGEVVQAEFERHCYPIYPASKHLQSWDIFACVRQVLEVLDPLPDPLPDSVLRARGLIAEDEAVRAIHLAEDPDERDRARERLTFDEAVGLQWALLGRRHAEVARSGPPAPPRADGLAAQMRRRLPFELTAGQFEVLDVLSGELSAARPMNRLLQGEVGSGKTIVALLTMLQAVDAGYQCALLAPTEVLAAQHRSSISDLLGPLGMGGQLGGADDATRIALLTGSMSAAEKKQARAVISTGQAGIVIGTHALLQDTVEFHSLGMVVVDEQHRFGVEQRDRLRAKAPENITPHLLVMTATPIPRTIALTVYGDLETSTLRELPSGRQPIATSAIFVSEKPAWLQRAWERIGEEVAAGRQAYVVTPRIDRADEGAESDAAEPGPPPSATAVDVFARLHDHELAGLRLGLMHGRLTPEEKETTMAGFRSGEIDVLVCTTVIEVGVDVPNATVMLVMDADRFGVSQLHQLRGRIGRGVHQGLCLLATRAPQDSTAGRRVQAVADTRDGFALADLDLAERGEGDVLGRQQSGWTRELKLLSLSHHRAVIEAAREFCAAAWDRDSARAGLSSLAARFTDAEHIEYLDKA